MKDVIIIQIQTIDDCNRKCSFCPNSTRTLSGNKMTLQTFEKIITDLKESSYNGRVHLHLMNEPLMDDRLPELAKSAINLLPSNYIGFVTNGDFLTNKMCKEYREMGLSQITISDYDEVHPLTTSDHFLFVRHMESFQSTMYNRAGHSNMKFDKPLKECTFVNRKMAINWRGDVILCCSDYDSEIVMGNVHDSSVQELWNSPLYNEYRQANENGTLNQMPLCDRCDRIC